MKLGVMGLVFSIGMNTMLLGWAGATVCEDVECRQLQMCEDDKAVTQRLIATRKQQCDTNGGAACQNYERSVNNPETKRLLEKPCKTLVSEGYGKH